MIEGRHVKSVNAQQPRGEPWTFTYRFEANGLDYYDICAGEKRIAYNICEKHKVKAICDAHNASIAAATEDTKRLVEVLRKVSEDLTCRDTGTHYCPNCDNSLFNLKAYAVEAIDAAMKSQEGK